MAQSGTDVPHSKTLSRLSARPACRQVLERERVSAAFRRTGVLCTAGRLAAPKLLWKSLTEVSRHHFGGLVILRGTFPMPPNSDYFRVIPTDSDQKKEKLKKKPKIAISVRSTAVKAPIRPFVLGLLSGLVIPVKKDKLLPC